ncbi:hypothetical protein N0V90_003891 [Kalmusia sp. IMI 367209]|nr:hypothetical protein N0V90_003891 [Kalmusia sp. IMI 367209]
MPPMTNLSSTTKQNLHYTTFSELKKYVLDNALMSDGYLPHHSTLQFEAVINEEVLAFFPAKCNVITVRLVLGHSQSNSKDTRTPVYAYMCRKDIECVSQVLLRLGTKTLKAHDMDDIDFETPFDLIYTTYKATDRAGDRLSTMAAHYFLAAGHIPEVTTRTDFRKSLTNLCRRMYKPAPGPMTLPGYATGANGITQTFDMNQSNYAGLGSSQRSEPNSLLQKGEDETRGRTRQRDLSRNTIQDTPKDPEANLNDLQNCEVDQSDNNKIPTLAHVREPSSLADLSPMHDVPAASRSYESHGYESSDTRTENSESNRHRRSFSDTHQSAIDATHPHRLQSKILNIDDLSIFVHEFKQLKAENVQLQKNQSRTTHLEALVDQLTRKVRKASNERAELKNMHYIRGQEIDHLNRQVNESSANADEIREELDKTKTEAEQLRKNLNECKSESETKYKRLQFKLGVQEVQAREAEKQAQALELQKVDLEDRLARANQSGVSNLQLATMKTDMDALMAENEGLKSKIQNLESEVLVEKDRFLDYRKKIRNLSRDA